MAVSTTRLWAAASWNALKSQQSSSAAHCAELYDPCGDASWKNLVEQTRALDGETRLRLVNDRVNQSIRYATDRENYNQEDRWASLDDTIERGAGDCEDIAIAKMSVLEAAGVPAGDMYIVVVKDGFLNAVHAVLLVRQDGRDYVLDNLTAWLITDPSLMKHYSPIYSVNEYGQWVYGTIQQSS